LYTDDLQIAATNINGYLADAASVYVQKSSSPKNGLPAMSSGSMPLDGGGLILSPDEASELKSDPAIARFVRLFLGSDEFIKGRDRYALWIPDDEKHAALSSPIVAARIDRVRTFRGESKRVATADLAEVPWRFGYRSHKSAEFVLVPKTSSGGREYIPIGYMGSGVVISDLAFAAYEAEPWVFALLTSAVHMAWTRAVGGRMKTDYRYSNTIVYNTFPVPPLSDAMKERLTVAALRVLDVREYHCERTLAELYDPDLMPDDLRRAHIEVDTLVDSLYSKRGYETDEQRLSDLFAMYEAMTAAEAPAKKTRSARK
jgi:hypothetical protein